MKREREPQKAQKAQEVRGASEKPSNKLGPPLKLSQKHSLFAGQNQTQRENRMP